MPLEYISKKDKKQNKDKEDNIPMIRSRISTYKDDKNKKYNGTIEIVTQIMSILESVLNF